MGLLGLFGSFGLRWAEGFLAQRLDGGLMRVQSLWVSIFLLGDGPDLDVWSVLHHLIKYNLLTSGEGGISLPSGPFLGGVLLIRVPHYMRGLKKGTEL